MFARANFAHNLANFYPILIKIYICVQETSSYKYSTPNHGFEHVKVIWQNWATN